MYKTPQEKRVRRHLRLRKKVIGSAERPRLCVSITANNIYVQFVDDGSGKTLASFSTLAKDFKALSLKRNIAAAQALGKLAAEKAMGAGIKEVVFDRGGFKYHGRIKALADAARGAGLKF